MWHAFVATVDAVDATTETLSTRPRNDLDVPEVVTWVQDASDLYLFSGLRLSWPLTTPQLQRMTSLDGFAAFVVVSEAADLVAHFDLTLDGTLARLGRVIVNPALRGRGLASRTIALALAESHRLGAKVVRLNVITTNEPALRAYRRAGFEVVGAEPSRPDVTSMERSVFSVSS